ncbi:MAG: RNA polymerase sigma factor, partial [Planctomycetes bacterium]|nr:RNA polymerase sigma factor [Planctomycetota bacterium]
MGEPSQFREPSRNAPTQLSPDQANRLWEEFRTSHNPAGRVALDGLYRSLRKPLVEFCMLKGCDPELADEIAETAFVRLIIRRPVARRGFIPLLRKTAQNLCRDAQKSRRRSPTLDPDLRDPTEYRAPTVRERVSPPSDAPSASERVSRDETIQAVQDCLAQLPPEHRAFIVYHEVEGLT